MTFGLPADGKPTDSIPLPDQQQQPERTAQTSRFDATAAQAVRMAAHYAPRGLFCVLMLVKPDAWMAGLWDETPDGWVNKRDNDKLLSWDAARVMVADRCSELNLDLEKVWAYTAKTGYTLEAEGFPSHHDFLNLSFESQMAFFAKERL
jgi:hypothetical protein